MKKNKEEDRMTEIKLCPFCGGRVGIMVSDDEGNLRDEEYEKNPWSGLSYQLSHNAYDNPNCPIASHKEDGGIVGVWLMRISKEL